MFTQLTELPKYLTFPGKRQNSQAEPPAFKLL